LQRISPKKKLQWPKLKLVIFAGTKIIILYSKCVYVVNSMKITPIIIDVLSKRTTANNKRDNDDNNTNKINKQRKKWMEKNTIWITQLGPKMTFVWRRKQSSVPLTRESYFTQDFQELQELVCKYNSTIFPNLFP
jgi:hypothetical protein